jgi:hypothetical protein
MRTLLLLGIAFGIAPACARAGDDPKPSLKLVVTFGNPRPNRAHLAPISSSKTGPPPAHLV